VPGVPGMLVLPVFRFVLLSLGLTIPVEDCAGGVPFFGVLLGDVLSPTPRGVAPVTGGPPRGVFPGKSTDAMRLTGDSSPKPETSLADLGDVDSRWA